MTAAPWNAARWPNFAPREIACRHCGRMPDMDDGFVRASLDALQDLRNVLGRPVALNSAYRCPVHNAAVGGAPMSLHKRIAFDVALAGHDRGIVLDRAAGAGFRGLGLGQHFIHLDRRARPARWFYGERSKALWKSFLG